MIKQYLNDNISINFFTRSLSDFVRKYGFISSHMLACAVTGKVPI